MSSSTFLSFRARLSPPPPYFSVHFPSSPWRLVAISTPSAPVRSINDGWRLDSRSQKPDPTTQTPYQLTLPNFGGFPRVFPPPQLRKPHPKWFDENIWNFYRVQIYAELLMSSPLRWPQKNDDDAVVTLKYEGHYLLAHWWFTTPHYYDPACLHFPTSERTSCF